MKKLLSLLAFAGLLIFVACSDDDEDPALPPSVTAPGSSSVEAGETVSLTFTVTSDAGITNVSASAVQGTATITAQPDNGATTGQVVVDYAAELTAAGVGAVTVTVTDAAGSDDATALVTIGEFQDEVIVSSNITGDVTWRANVTYILGTRVAVESGATLTIEPGTVIKGEAGTGANATALVVARGATLNAGGTAAAPIIFTSVADEITPADVAAGNFASPNLDADINGLWGGVIVLGNAPISVSGDGTEAQIEGIPPSDTNGRYGGSTADDNSGTITYISIRHGGSNIGEGNEINGLTLGGVGSGTTIDYVEVVGNQDDGVEWFGGSVNVGNVVVWNAGDDAIDTDQAWSGTLTNFAVVAGSDTDHALELDGPEGSLAGKHTLVDGTCKGQSEDDEDNPGNIIGNTELGDMRSGAQVQLTDVYFFGFPDPNVADGRGDFSESGCDDCTYTNLEATLQGTATLADTFKGGSFSAASSVAAGAQTGGADASVLTGWTWAGEVGGLDDF